MICAVALWRGIAAAMAQGARQAGDKLRRFPVGRKDMFMHAGLPRCQSAAAPHCRAPR